MLEWKGKTGVLGVIGGMGPLASQLFYRKVIEMTEAVCDQDHIDVILLSHASMPDRTEAILPGGEQKAERLKKLLLSDARMLEEQGACCIAIPCNTSHYFLDEIQKQLRIPLINMIHETVKEVVEHTPKVKRVGILATDGTIQMGLYHKAFSEAGLEAAAPSKRLQKTVMEIIYDGIKGGGPIDLEDFLAVEQELLERGCQAAVMACTELSCLKEQYKLSDYFVDAMDVLAKRSIEICGGVVRE